jgi:hypothetical protein
MRTFKLFLYSDVYGDRLYGLVVRVPGYRSRGPRFDSRCHQIFWEVVGLERCPLSLVSTSEELLGRDSSGSGLENREYGRGDPKRWSRDTLYPQKLALTLPTKGDRSVGIVRLRTKATEFVFFRLMLTGMVTCLFGFTYFPFPFLSFRSGQAFQKICCGFHCLLLTDPDLMDIYIAVVILTWVVHRYRLC